jgi:hypothetical protein
VKLLSRIAALGAAAFLGLSLLFGASPASAAQPATVDASAVSAVGSGIVRMDAGPGHVSIPARYVYNPNTNKQRTLHDYCTKSPDNFRGADFRGPCARHDLCIMDRDVKRSTCDARFLDNIMQECSHTYDKFLEKPIKVLCQDTALTYYAVVRAKTFLS